MARRLPSFLVRVLEPLPATVWALFLIWTAIVAVVWIGEIGDVDLQQRITNPGLRGALAFFLRTLDAVWCVLAAVNVYLALVGEESLAVARRWASLIIVGSWLVSALSEWTAYPLGAIHYTARLGLKIGPVPFGLLLLWFALVIGARALAMHLAPRASHAKISLATGALVALTVVSLDPLAWRFRAFWLWHPDAVSPLATAQNLATWLLAASAFAFAMRETRVAVNALAPFPRSASVFLLCNAVFLATHLARMARR